MASQKKKTKKKPLKKEFTRSISKYALYEEAVQCPDWHTTHFPRFHEWILGKGKVPRRLREDFCGTARISCEWVKSHKDRRAVGLDLDPEPLAYAEQENLSSLTSSERERIELRQQDVMVPTQDKFDLVATCNFSFFIFKERKLVIDYFKAVHASLDKKGTVFLEMAGGEGMIERMEESRAFRMRGFGKFKYVWEQHQFDPISCVSDYSIHFQQPNRRWMKDVFTYHWRIWGIREVREMLLDAGFKRTVVFWETLDKNGRGTGDYVPAETGDHAHAWIAYVVGVKE